MSGNVSSGRTPSYWISSSWIYSKLTNAIELTVRQTGVAPDHLKELYLTVTFIHNSRKTTNSVILKNSCIDNLFKSSVHHFPIKDTNNVSKARVVFKVYTTTKLFRRSVDKWESDLSGCFSSTPRVTFQRVSFDK